MWQCPPRCRSGRAHENDGTELGRCRRRARIRHLGRLVGRPTTAAGTTTGGDPERVKSDWPHLCSSTTGSSGARTGEHTQVSGTPSGQPWFLPNECSRAGGSISAPLPSSRAQHVTKLTGPSAEAIGSLLPAVKGSRAALATASAMVITAGDRLGTVAQSLVMNPTTARTHCLPTMCCATVGE